MNNRFKLSEVEALKLTLERNSRNKDSIIHSFKREESNFSTQPIYNDCNLNLTFVYKQ